MFSQYGPHASSIEFLLSRLYFEFPYGTEHLIATIRRQKFVFITPFLQNICQMFWSDNKEKVSSTEMFRFEYLFKKTNQWNHCVSGPSQRPV